MARQQNPNPAGLKLLCYCPDLDPLSRDAIGWEIRADIRGNVTRIATEAVWPYFAQGYVDADKPRDSAYSDDIVAAREGWALADQQGNILAKFDDLKEAEQARANATSTVELSLTTA